MQAPKTENKWPKQTSHESKLKFKAIEVFSMVNTNTVVQFGPQAMPNKSIAL